MQSAQPTQRQNEQQGNGRGRGARARYSDGPTRGRRENQQWVNKSTAAVSTEPSLRGPRQWKERRQQEPEIGRLSISKVPNTVPPLVQELQDKLRKGDLECMICYEVVGRSAQIWSCSSCYAIFHLSCIRKWARAPTSMDRSEADVNWRCPGCQAIQHTFASALQYWCFCEQQPDPPVDYYLTPHSCGGPCKRPLDRSKTGQCNHLCTLQCHPGPCPPCVAFAAPETCGCGRTTVTRRCVEKDGHSVSCGRPCGRMLPCGRHSCSRICHDGDCGSCDALVMVRCFCDRKQEVLACGQVSAVGELNCGGIFSCETTCNRQLSCGNHSCQNKCHPGSCGACEYSPENMVTCPCGKQVLPKRGQLRKTCLDPISTCEQVCGKLMKCGKHPCQSLCHVGNCPPCHVQVEQKCRCGGSSRIVLCSSGKDNVFICDRKCGRKRHCGRHRCNNRCCPPDDGHVCFLECGKKLRCGEHSCQELCHPGHCPPCLQSSFTELMCACGKSSIPPPVPCGTQPPRCELPCLIPQPCGHEATHPCHFGECPPCTVPVTKECVGEHMLMRNVPCGSKEIKCNNPCRKPRKCGLHHCGRTCHADPCDEPSDSLSCGQVCGAPRQKCSHTCVAPCHPFDSCPNLRCTSMVTITCNCGRLSAEVPCDTGGPNLDPGEAMKYLHFLPPLQPVQEKVPFSQRKIACDDECAKAQKLKGLAEALGINSSTGEAIATYGTSDSLQEMLKRDSQFVSCVEDRLKYLLMGPKSAVACVTGMRVHVFCQLPKDKRDVIYQLAQRWNFSVSSVRWEPKRYMIVHVNAKTKMPGRVIRLPTFSSSLDVDPRQVVALLDLPREGDISSLVLRFGGECELIWLNDRNALAIFGDPSRAATALKRVDHACPYRGAVEYNVPPQRQVAWGSSSSSPAGWGSTTGSQASWASATASSPPRRTMESSNKSDDSWDEQSRGVWVRTKPVPVSNPWKALEEASGSPSSSSIDSSKLGEGSNIPSNNNSTTQAVVEDWESGYE